MNGGTAKEPGNPDFQLAATAAERLGEDGAELLLREHAAGRLKLYGWRISENGHPGDRQEIPPLSLLDGVVLNIETKEIEADAKNRDFGQFERAISRAQWREVWVSKAAVSGLLRKVQSPKYRVAVAERRCSDWLLEEMHAHEKPQMTREQYWTHAKKRWPLLSKRGFKRVWDNGIKETGRDAWCAAGRRRKAPD